MLTWQAHKAAVHALAFTTDGSRLLTSGGDGRVRLWDVRTQSAVRGWRYDTSGEVALSGDGRFVLLAGDGTVTLYAVDDPSPVGSYQSDGGGVAFSPDDGSFLMHGDERNPLFSCAIVDDELVPGETWAHPNGVTFTGPFAYSPDGATVAVMCCDRDNFGTLTSSVLVFTHSVTGAEVGRLRLGRVPAYPSRLAFSPDGNLLAGMCGPAFLMWDVPSRTEYGRGRVRGKRFEGLAFTPDGSRLLTASGDQFLREWTAPTWEQTTIYTWDSGKLGCVAVSADGTVAAAGGSTGKVVVWDLE
jgi:WD40 repeat protein